MTKLNPFKRRRRRSRRRRRPKLTPPLHTATKSDRPTALRPRRVELAPALMLRTSRAFNQANVFPRIIPSRDSIDQEVNGSFYLQAPFSTQTFQAHVCKIICFSVDISNVCTISQHLRAIHNHIARDPDVTFSVDRAKC